LLQDFQMIGRDGGYVAKLSINDFGMEERHWTLVVSYWRGDYDILFL